MVETVVMVVTEGIMHLVVQKEREDGTALMRLGGAATVAEAAIVVAAAVEPVDLEVPAMACTCTCLLQH